MTISSVGTTTFLADTIMLIRIEIQDNITDPISSTRPSSEKFVVTAYPQRGVSYPIITVVDKGLIDYTLAQPYDSVQNGAGGYYIDTSLLLPYNQPASEYFKARLAYYTILKDAIANVSAVDLDPNTKQLTSKITWAEGTDQVSDQLETVMAR